MTTASKKHLAYIPAFDGVRALAVILVMLGHVGVPGFAGGGLGVDIFFVLSGFLITTLLLEELGDTGRINVLHFYARRLLRLYPALLLLILLLAVFFHIMSQALPHPEDLHYVMDMGLAALYLTDYAVAFGLENKNSLLAHTWSLAVEEHFYLLWPFVLPALRRAFRGKRLVIALLALYAVATAWRVLCLSFQSWEMVYFRFDTRLAGLVLGAALAAIRMHGIKVKGAQAGLALSGLAFLFCIYWMPGMEDNTYLTTVAEIFAFFLLSHILEIKDWVVSGWLSQKIPVFFGRISYAIYLFHFPVAVLLFRATDGRPGQGHEHWSICFEVTFALSVALACFSWKTVEKAGRVRAKQFHARGTGKHMPADKKG